MKKLKVISILSLLILNISNICFAFDIDMNIDNTKEIKSNSEIVYTLTLSEKIIGASFKIDYDSDKLELLESKTSNLSVSENNGKIACIYFDMNKTPIDTLSIKFKAKTDIKNADLSFKLEDSKFIIENNETTYSQDNITGISKVITIKDSSNETKNTVNNSNKTVNSTNLSNTNSNSTITSTNINTSNQKNNIKQNNTKVDSTTTNQILPATGTDNYLVIAIILVIMVAINFYWKMKKV